MSIRHLSYVVCDRCNGYSAQPAEGVAQARQIARREGYIRSGVPVEDVCPVCAGKVWDGVRWVVSVRLTT